MNASSRTAMADRFSREEMDRRRAAIEAEMDRAGVDRLLVYGSSRNGTAIQWLSQWPVTQEAVLLWGPGTAPVLFVEFANHVPDATARADRVEVRWGGGRPVDAALELLGREGARTARVGIIGPLPAKSLAAVEAAAAGYRFLDASYLQLRLVKSPEEIAWLRAGARLTDEAVAHMTELAEIGQTEIELCARLEESYLPLGGTNHIHYLGTTSMAAPNLVVPRQWPSNRAIAEGDVLVCEVSASWWGYPGQLLRTFTIGCAPDARYRALHDVADAAYAEIRGCVAPGARIADLARAAELVERAGYRTCDDLVHGFGGGYLAPLVPGGGRPGLDPSFSLEAGMVLVVQPNVVSDDNRSGVQTGELLVVTEGGSETLHRFPEGLGRIL